MTAKDLIEILQDMDPNTEVRLAIQPNYPFEHSIDGIATIKENGEEIAFIYEGGQIGYLGQEAAVACGWAEHDETDEERDEEEGGPDYDTRDEE